MNLPPESSHINSCTARNLAPLIGHGLGDSGIGAGSFFPPFKPRFCPMYSRNSRSWLLFAEQIIFSVCRLERREILEPKASCLGLPMPELPRLNKLRVISDQLSGIAVRNRVFHADSWNISVPERIEELCRFEHLTPSFLAVYFSPVASAGDNVIVKVPHAGIGQVGARRMSNHQIPFWIMFQNVQHAHFKVLPWSFRWQQVTAPSVVSQRRKGVSHDSAELACYEYFHVNSCTARNHNAASQPKGSSG